jgi:adhesin/invasin
MRRIENPQLIHHSNQFGSPEKWGKIIAPFLLAGAMLVVLLGIVSPPASAAGELIIDKYASSSQIYAGDTVQYTIVVTNPTSTDYLVTVSDTLPPGVEVVSNPNGAAINGSVLRWLEIGLPRNQAKQVTFTARITKSGTIINSDYSADAGGGINGTGSPVPVEVLPGPPQRVNIEALPPSATVGPGSIVNLTITVADQYGNPVTNNTGVEINFTLGSIEGKSPGQFVSGVTDSNGQLLKVLNVLTVAGTARITATAAGLGQGSLSVPFNPDVPAALNVTANPTSISTVGTQKSTITAQVVDQYNNPLSSLPITFTTSLGLFNSPPGSSSVVVNTVNGQASAQLSGSVAGTATITVTAPGVPPRPTPVYLAPGPAAQMRFEPPPDTEISIVANGVSTATMSLLLRDANGNLTQTPTEVTLSTTLGTLNGGGSTYQETTSTGQVLITLTSITRTGTAKITASAVGLTTDRTVNFVPGNPASIVLEVTPPAICGR